jgi:predicted NBD/HSP70 family sugar kinase
MLSDRVKTATPASVREVNRSIILNLIRLHQPVSRAGLSDLTGIHPSNISLIVDELMEWQLITEQKIEPRGRGRAPIMLSLSPGAFLVIGVSVRTNDTAVCLAGVNGGAQASVSFRTPSTPGEFVNELAAAIDGLRRGGSVKREIRQLCIGVPGLVNLERGEIHWMPSLPQYSDFPLHAAVESATGIPASVVNDCDLAAIAERWLSEQPSQMRDFVFLNIGTVGVGAGIMINGELCKGHDSMFAGEFGHMAISPTGPRCTCGRRGCWELYVCDKATWARYDPEHDYSTSRFDELMLLARAGERRALRAVRETGKYLSLGISNIVFALNPRTVILSGHITEIWDVAQDHLLGAYSSPRIQFDVRPSRAPAEDLFLQGAISCALDELYAKPRLG